MGANLIRHHSSSECDVDVEGTGESVWSRQNRLRIVATEPWLNKPRGDGGLETRDHGRHHAPLLCWYNGIVRAATSGRRAG